MFLEFILEYGDENWISFNLNDNDFLKKYTINTESQMQRINLVSRVSKTRPNGSIFTIYLTSNNLKLFLEPFQQYFTFKENVKLLKSMFTILYE